MGKRGPKKLPVAIVKERGTYRPSSHRDEIADTTPKMDWVYNTLPPPPPDFLNDRAKDVWDCQLREAQKTRGYIGFIDLILFAEYCYVVAEMDELRREGSEKHYTDNNGVKRVNPMYLELGKLRKDLLKLSQEFGFSPSARTSIRLQQEEVQQKEEDNYTGL